MLPLGEAHEEDNLEVRWGRKTGVGVRNKDVQFYASFTSGGVEYFLYDCVYMWRHNELDIGKIVKLFDSVSHEKWAKVVWFLRPIEVRQWLGDVEPLWNEVFLASGEGKGLFNYNPLEAICGKCNVVCMSKDKRNPQATKEELKMADCIFYRTFDVARCTISPIFADVIAGTEVKHFFNREKDQKFTASEVGANLNGKIANPSLFVKVEGVMDLRNPEKDVADKAEMKQDLNVSPASSCDLESRKKRELQFGGPEEDHVKLSNTLPRAPDASDSVINNLKHSNGDKGSKFDNQFQEVTRRPVEGVTVLRNPEKDDKAEMKRVQNLSPTSFSYSESTKRRKLQFSDVGPKEDPVKLSNTLPRAPDAPDSAIKNFKHSNGDKGSKSNNQLLEVTRRPAAETSKWFEQQPWEIKMKSAHDRGTLVLLENLDPSYTSSEVQDIIWSAFNVTGEAKIIPRCAMSSRHHGQAFFIFKSEDAADHAISELKGKCLMLPNGRPLVGRKGCPVEPKNCTRFVGHLVIDKLKSRKQSVEWKIAVSTSHYSQPNTIEYDMALEWLVLQEISKLRWDALNKQHAKEIEQLRSQLKTRHDL